MNYVFVLELVLQQLSRNITFSSVYMYILLCLCFTGLYIYIYIYYTTHFNGTWKWVCLCHGIEGTDLGRVNELLRPPVLRDTL
jgi:hypothetical protein